MDTSCIIVNRLGNVMGRVSICILCLNSPCRKRHANLTTHSIGHTDDGGIGIVEMLFCTSLVALVGAGESPAFSPRKLQIINTKRQSIICELTFITAILAVKLNRKRLIVVLEEHIYIYDISNMKLLHTIDTCPNPNAIVALSPSSENCYLAYPPNASSGVASSSSMPTNASASNMSLASPLSGTPNTFGPLSSSGSSGGGSAGSFSGGEVLIFDAIHLQPINIIQAHKSPISCLQFNHDGTLLATASDKGTVIRVFSVPQGQKLFQFRRGTYPARIYSISFSMDGGSGSSSDESSGSVMNGGRSRGVSSSYLAVSSDSDTVHVFRLDSSKKKGDESGNAYNNSSSSTTTSSKRSNMISSITSSIAATFLPDMVTEMWEPQRDFAYAKLRGLGSGTRGNSFSGVMGLGIPGFGGSNGSGSGDENASSAPVSGSAGSNGNGGNSVKIAICGLIQPGSGTVSGGGSGGAGSGPSGGGSGGIVGIGGSAGIGSSGASGSGGGMVLGGSGSNAANLPQLVVISTDGHVYYYGMDAETGGECVLLREHSLVQ